MKKLFSILLVLNYLFSGLTFAQTYTTYYPEIVYFKSDWCPSTYDLEHLRRSAPNLYFKYSGYSSYSAGNHSCCVDRIILPDGESRARIIENFPEGVADKEDNASCSGKIPTEEEALKLLSGETTYAVLRKKKIITNNSATEVNSKKNNTTYSGRSNYSSLGGICYTGPRGGTYTITSSGRKNYSGC